MSTRSYMTAGGVGGGRTPQKVIVRLPALPASALRQYIHASPNKSKKKNKKKPCPYSRTGDVATIMNKNRLVYTRGTGNTLYVRWNGRYTKLSQIIREQLKTVADGKM